MVSHLVLFTANSLATKAYPELFWVTAIQDPGQKLLPCGGRWGWHHQAILWGTPLGSMNNKHGQV